MIIKKYNNRVYNFENNRIYIHLVKVLLLLIIPNICYGWEWINPKYSGNSISQIIFVNDKTGFAVGVSGKHLSQIIFIIYFQ